MSLQQQYTWPFPPRRRTQPLRYICISENKSYQEVGGPLESEKALSPSTSQEAIVKKSIAVHYDGALDGCDDHRMLLYLEAQRN